jgi:hypothetical protein
MGKPRTPETSDWNATKAALSDDSEKSLSNARRSWTGHVSLEDNGSLFLWARSAMLGQMNTDGAATNNVGPSALKRVAWMFYDAKNRDIMQGEWFKDGEECRVWGVDGDDHKTNAFWDRVSRSRNDFESSGKIEHET